MRICLFYVVFPFPDELQFSEWAGWSVCSQTCSTDDVPSIKTRKRKCYHPEGKCVGDLLTTTPCDVPQCPGNVQNIQFYCILFKK